MSVVIPVYNSERYLEECITSVINQSYKNLEIILVNDGSTDKSLRICNSFAKKDSRIIVESQSNQGPGSARNCGVRKSSGNFVTFVDSDDFISPSFIESHMNQIITNNIQLTVSGIKIFSNSKLLGEFNYYKDIINQRSNSIVKDYLEIMAVNKANVYFGSNNNKIYNNNIIKENNIVFNGNTIYAEDFEFNIDYLKYIKNLSVISESFYFYRYDNNNSISKTEKKPEVFWKRFREIFPKYREVMNQNNIDSTDRNAFLVYTATIYFSHEIATHEVFSMNEKKNVVNTVFRDPEIKKITGFAKGHTAFEKLTAYFINRSSKRLMVIALIIRHVLRNIKIKMLF